MKNPRLLDITMRPKLWAILRKEKYLTGKSFAELVRLAILKVYDKKGGGKNGRR